MNGLSPSPGPPSIAPPAPGPGRSSGGRPPTATPVSGVGEASGSVAADYSGFGRDGVYNGTPGYHATSLRADTAGYGVTFSGDDYVDVPWGSWMEATAITVEAFIKTTASGSTQVIASRDQIGIGRQSGQQHFASRSGGARCKRAISGDAGNGEQYSRHDAEHLLHARHSPWRKRPGEAN